MGNQQGQNGSNDGQQGLVSTGSRWFSVHVPDASGSGKHESFLRVGAPNKATESGFLDALKQSYRDATGDDAVKAAFGEEASDGIVHYTQGNLTQLVGGKVDTRVFNDSFTVNVLNRSDEDESVTSTNEHKTYRSYLRLGKPNKTLEASFTSVTPPHLIVSMIRELGLQKKDWSAWQLDLATAVESVLNGTSATREALLARAKLGDDDALAKLEELRVSTDARATTVYAGKDAHRWALGALHEVHAEAAAQHAAKARTGNTDSQSKLAERARAGDAAALREIQLISETTVDAEFPAKTWAKTVLKKLGTDLDRRPRFSLGDGIAMFSDKAINVTTPEPFKVTAGKDSRTILGDSYSETYDVSDDDLEKIRSGEYTGLTQLESRKLVTASLTRKNAMGLWRTTKFDTSKALSFAVADNAAVTLGAAYACIGGMKLDNLIGAKFEANMGFTMAAPTGSKAELVGTGMETTWAKGKVNYKETQSLKGRSVEIKVDPAAIFCGETMGQLTTAIRVITTAVNAALLAYATALSFASLAGDTDDDGEAEIRGWLEVAEAIYAIVLAINTVMAVAMAIASIVQIATEKASKGAGFLPTTSTMIKLNEGGIHMQCGSSYLEIDPSGIKMNGTQIQVGSPSAQFLPIGVPANTTPVQVMDLVRFLSSVGDAHTGPVVMPV